MKSKFFYLIHIQYLGFRYHGWAKQTGVKTVHQMIDKTLDFVFKDLGSEKFQTLGCSRTDSKVSANHMIFELFVDEELNQSDFLEKLNSNLPQDIKGLKIEQTNSQFNIIQSVKVKEYVYLFSFGEKANPFSAPFLTSILDDLDIELMRTGAKLFLGVHNFQKYCTKLSDGTEFQREVILSEIKENNIYTANFFPEKTYAYHIHSKGFMRNQVRLIMGQLFKLGKGLISLNEIKASLENLGDEKVEALREIAPASGLILNKVTHV